MNRDPQHPIFWNWRGTTYVRMPIIVFSGLVLALLAMTILFWSVKRRTDPDLQVKDVGSPRAVSGPDTRTPIEGWAR